MVEYVLCNKATGTCNATINVPACPLLSVTQDGKFFDTFGGYYGALRNASGLHR